MPSRPATLKDPGTPDQIVLEQHNLTPQTQLDSSKVWLGKKPLQRRKISRQAWGIHSTQKINDMSYNQLISDLFDVLKKTYTTITVHMDDVVGTRPEEHLMSDFEHLKTRVYLTDVLQNEGVKVNFRGLQITKARRGVEVKNSTGLV